MSGWGIVSRVSPVHTATVERGYGDTLGKHFLSASDRSCPPNRVLVALVFLPTVVGEGEILAIDPQHIANANVIDGKVFWVQYGQNCRRH